MYKVKYKYVKIVPEISQYWINVLSYIPPLLITDIMKLSVELHWTWKMLETSHK